MVKSFDKIRIRNTAGPLYEKIDQLLEDTLLQYPTISEYDKFRAQIEIQEIVDEDINALAEKDPAARVSGDINLCKDYVAETYSSLYAVVCYRVAHYLQCGFMPQLQQENSDIRDYLKKEARKISEKCKNETGGIEIHPAAKIGKRFVLDHGSGTVIGETSEIGDECCFLNAVTLGARLINPGEKDTPINFDNKKKRHPTIGNRVTIGGHVRVLGDITIGDDSFIQPYSIVLESIPPCSIVRVTNQLQVIRLDSDKYKELTTKIIVKSDSDLEDLSENLLNDPMIIYGVVPGKNGRGIEIIGRNLKKCTDIKLIDNRVLDNDLIKGSKELFLENVGIKYVVYDDVINMEITTRFDIRGCSIYLCAKEYSCIVKDARAWKEYIKTIL